MANFYDDNEDLKFYIERAIDWEPLVRITEFDWRSPDGFENTEEAVDFYKSVLELIGGFAGDEIAPKALELDAAHPRVENGEVVYPAVTNELYAQMAELELSGMCVPRELGGMNCPLLLSMIGIEILSRADVSVCAHHGFHGGIAMAALSYSVLEGTTEFDKETATITKTRFAECIEDILTNEGFGSMDITEPSAGSDMGAIRCKGEQDEDGNWFVTGPKIFITSGHGKWHFVIARTELAEEGADAFAGLKGMSMFLVPAWSEDEDGNRVRHITVDGVEEKLGHNGSATCALSYEHAPAHLIGKRGEGFKKMLLLMNNARIGVGFESLGLCEAAYRLAKSYAAERPSMGKMIDQHEMIADYLDEMRTDIQAIRCMAVHASQYEELAQKYKMLLQFDPPADEAERAKLEKQARRFEKRTRHLTPLLKYIASEKAVEMGRRAVQILGGCGYMVEYGAEKLLRDAMVMPIYEGTSQIQALMVMKDNLMGAVKHPRSFMRKAAQARWRAVSARDPHVRRVARLQSIQYSTLQFLLSRLVGGKVKELRHHSLAKWGKVMTGWDPKRDFALAMLHAERLTKILTDVAICEELLEQVQRFPERGPILEAYLERAEPRCRFLNDEITTTGLRLLASLSADETQEEQAAK